MRCGNIHARFVGWIVLALAGLFGCGYFATLASAAPDYFVRTWQAEQGLPQNKVTAVVQTRDGYLWAGTYSGLVRFDGMRFTVFDGNNTPELRNSRVTSLFESPRSFFITFIGTPLGSSTNFTSS